MGKGHPPFLSALTILGFALATSGSAYAVPPPPAFSSFTILNSCTQTVTSIEISMYLSDEALHQTLEPEPVVLKIPVLKAGRSLVLGLGSGPFPGGTWGVSRIEVKAGCPDANHPINGILTITATQNLAFVPTVPGAEYAGFCAASPDGTQDYEPTLEFGLNPSTNKEFARLRGKSRWGLYWDAQPKDVTVSFR